MSRVGFRRFSLPMGIVLVCLAIVLTVGVYFQDSWRDSVIGASTGESKTPPPLTFSPAKGGKYHDPLRKAINLPGVVNPRLHPIGKLALPEETRILGVDIAGTAYAFVLSGMLEPKRHVVNMMVDKTAISITYCELADCARVFTKDDAQPIPLRIGGLDVNNHMVLMLNSICYDQSSEQIPLKDYPFSRTNLGQWKKKHPNAMVFLGSIEEHLAR